MMCYKFSNIDITNEYISADVYDNQQYIMRLTDCILHIKYTDLNNELYTEFQKVARFHLSDYDGEPEDEPAGLGKNIIKWDFKKRPI